MKLLILLGLLAWTASAQVWPSRPATAQDLGVATDNAMGLLMVAIGPSDLTWTVSNAGSFKPYNMPIIDGEKVEVCANTTTTVIICPGARGLDGTTAASHAQGATLSAIVHSSYTNRANAEIEAIEANMTAGGGGGGGGGSGGGSTYVPPYINVQSAPYLAKGDCVTDDGPAIQAALNAGGYIVFPRPPGGCYMTGETLIQMRGTYVYGFSADSPIDSPAPQVPGVTIKLMAHKNVPIWETYDAANNAGGNEFYAIDNIVFNGNGENQDSELTPHPSASAQACVDYRGTFVLSTMRRVQITHCFGTALFPGPTELDNVWAFNNTTSSYNVIINPGPTPGFGGSLWNSLFVEENMIPQGGHFNDAFGFGSPVNNPAMFSHAILINGTNAHTVNLLHCESALTCIDFRGVAGMSLNGVSADRIGNPSDSDPTNQFLFRDLDNTTTFSFNFQNVYFDQVGSINTSGYPNARVFGLANGVTSQDIYQTPPAVTIWPTYAWARIDQAQSHAPYLGERPIVGNELWIQQIGAYSPNYLKFYGAAQPGDAAGPAWWSTGSSFGHETAPYTGEQSFIIMNDYSTSDPTQNSVTFPGEHVAITSTDQSKFALLQEDSTNGNFVVSGNMSNFLYSSANSYFGLDGGNNNRGTGINLQGLTGHPYAYRGGTSSNVIYLPGFGWQQGFLGADFAVTEYTNGGNTCSFNDSAGTSGTILTDSQFLTHASGCFTSGLNLVMGPAFNSGSGYILSNDDANITGSVIANNLKLKAASAPSCGHISGNDVGRGTFNFVTDGTNTNDHLDVCSYTSGTLGWHRVY